MVELKLEGCCPLVIYDDGRIFAVKSNRFLSPYDNGLGYLAVKVKNEDGSRSQKYVHRLVAMAYLDEWKQDVNHKDGNKKNNSVSNLEWMTRSENLKHAFDNGLCRGFVEKYYCGVAQ